LSSVKYHLIPITILILFSALIYVNTLENGFIWDDTGEIENNEYIRSLKYIPLILSGGYWHNRQAHNLGVEYRPLSQISYAIDYVFWKLDPRGYKLTNIVIYCLNVIMVYILIGQCLLVCNSKSRIRSYEGPFFIIVPFLAALLFASHPVHAEAINWTKNRAELIAAFFIFFSTFLFLRSVLQLSLKKRLTYYVFSIVAGTFAFLSKETAISLSLVLFMSLFFLDDKARIRTSLLMISPFIIITAVYLYMKVSSHGGMSKAADNLPSIGMYANILAVFKTYGIYFVMLVYPGTLNAMRQFDEPVYFMEWEVFWSFLLVFVLIGIAVEIYRRHRVYSYGIFWIFMTLLPVSNIFYLASRPIAEQRLYIPSLGFCLILALMINKLYFLKAGKPANDVFRAIALALIVSIVTVYSVIVFRRNKDWHDSYTFWLDTIRKAPKNAKAYNNFGNSIYLKGDVKGAVSMYRKAIELNPNHAEVFNNLGVAMRSLRRPADAVSFFKKAIEINPSYGSAHNNLARTYCQLKRYDLAVDHVKRAMKYGSDVDAEVLNILKSISERADAPSF